MKTLLIFACFFFSPLFSYGDSIPLDSFLKQARKRCGFKNQADVSYSKIFNPLWNINFATIQKNRTDEKLYRLPERLGRRAFFDSSQGKFKLLLGLAHDQLITIPDAFLKNVSLHIEEALHKKYADFISFTDMGHAHFFIPKPFFEREIKKIKIRNLHRAYEKMLEHEHTKFIYHTAEQIKLIERVAGKIKLPKNPHLKHRYLTRNVVASNTPGKELKVLKVKNLEHRYNTVNSLPGHVFWSNGYYVESNQNACFPYKKGNETLYFDLGFNLI